VSYNGWTNYETWAMGMHVDGNYGGEATYHYWLEVAREIFEESEDDSTLTKEENAHLALSYRIKEEVAESIPESMDTGVLGDLLRAALHDVNWYDVASHIMTTIIEEVGAGSE